LLDPIERRLKIDPHIRLIAAMAADSHAFNLWRGRRYVAFGHRSRLLGVIGQGAGYDHFSFITAIFALADFFSDDFVHDFSLLLRMIIMFPVKIKYQSASRKSCRHWIASRPILDRGFIFQFDRNDEPRL
jgi:hypothetical protein